MVIASHMEGGANVIIEAVTSGVPVLASDIGGNRGMLGDDYPGLFAPGDAAALARLIERSATDPASTPACCAAALRARACSPRAPSKHACSTWWIICCRTAPAPAQPNKVCKHEQPTRTSPSN
jgi:glycosyltransferase involved in cell wall biosynthesis